MPIPGDRLRLAAALLSAPGKDGAAELRALVRDHDWPADAVAEIDALPLAEWQAEHGRLFIGVGRGTPCLPFESAQLHGTMYGPATAAVAALYHRLGLEADDLPADYLGSMLECAAYLADADERAVAEEEELWRDHLLRWLPTYAQTLVAESRLALYRDLGREFANFCRAATHE